MMKLRFTVNDDDSYNYGKLIHLKNYTNNMKYLKLRNILFNYAVVVDS